MTITGKLIVFEGVEGSGKTTQLEKLKPWLLAKLSDDEPPRKVVLTREPGGTMLGKQLRQLLLTQSELDQEEIQNRAELLLYGADRAQHVESYLIPHLQQGHIVLCDRYTDSTLAYQGYGRGLDLKLIEAVNQLATGGLVSDLTLWLDVEVEVGLARVRQRQKMDRIEQADLAFHQRVCQGYRQLAVQQPDRIQRVDAGLSISQVAEQIQNIIQKHLPSLFCTTFPRNSIVPD